MTFLTLVLAQTLGNLIGNFLLILTLGYFIRFNEQRKREKLQAEMQAKFMQYQSQVLEAVRKENDRMTKYAELEGLPTAD